MQIMLEAWDEVDPQLGANAWEVVKLMPYELAQVRGWTPKQAFFVEKTQLRRDANHAVSLVMVIACKTDFFAPHATMRECNNKRKIAKRKEVLSKRHPQQPNPLPKSQECPLDYLRLGNQVIPQQHQKPNPTNLHRKRGRMLLCLLAYQQPQSVLLREEPQARETHWCEQRSAWCRKQ